MSDNLSRANIPNPWQREKRAGSGRVSLEIEAEVKQVDTAKFRTRLTDLSSTGFQISCPISLDMHKPLMIKIPGLEMLPARIVWTKEYRFGCQFRNSLYPAVFDHIVRNAIR